MAYQHWRLCRYNASGTQKKKKEKDTSVHNKKSATSSSIEMTRGQKAKQQIKNIENKHEKIKKNEHTDTSFDKGRESHCRWSRKD